MKKKVHMDEVPLLELMTEHCLKIAALIFYCALDCLINKSVRIRKSSIGFVEFRFFVIERHGQVPFEAGMLQRNIQIRFFRFVSLCFLLINCSSIFWYLALVH